MDPETLPVYRPRFGLLLSQETEPNLPRVMIHPCTKLQHRQNEGTPPRLGHGTCPKAHTMVSECCFPLKEILGKGLGSGAEEG